MKYCRYCGSELADEAVVCIKCGCPSEAIDTAEVQAPQERKMSMLTLLGFISSLLSMILPAFSLFAIAGLVMSIVGFVRLKRTEEQRGKGFAIAGIVIGAVGIVWGIIYTILAGVLIEYFIYEAIYFE